VPSFGYRVYRVLLVFVVAVGLPILALPALRHRLSGRVALLREAMGPPALKQPPAWAKVGENRYPFPTELERPVPRSTLHADGVFALPGYVYRPPPSQPWSSSAAPSEAESSSAGAATEGAPPEYRQGKAEAEAFDLVKGRPAVGALLGGSNPALRFKNWGAARRENDAFWVDLTFLDSSEPGAAREVHYIWKVDLASREVTPLSHNARALPK
jgi:hypothetical protein